MTLTPPPLSAVGYPCLVCTLYPYRLGARVSDRALSAAGYPCGSPGKPLHGSVSPRGQLFYAGENVTITCRPGYVRFGQPTRTCSQDGTWQGLMPFCSEYRYLPHVTRLHQLMNGFGNLCSYSLLAYPWSVPY